MPPAAHPPKNPKLSNQYSGLPSYLISVASQLTLYFSLKTYSSRFLPTISFVTIMQIIRKTICKNQYMVEQYWTPSIDLVVLLPNDKFSTTSNAIKHSAVSCFDHWKWDFSRLASSNNKLSSARLFSFSVLSNSLPFIL